ncbi:MAG TPA: ABC transporter permease [Blastocatellia bacterium]|nr:ABC transporter permease [Blastocatellia bacterium]
MASFFHDLRFGIRILFRKAGFTLIAVLTLALGIGATTAIFSVVNAVLLRPLPYPDSDRLLFVGQQFRGGQGAAGEPKFLFWREQQQSFEALTCFSSVGMRGGNLTGGNEAELVQMLRISEEFFRTFGLHPAIGRGFTKEEDAPGGARVAILSDSLWRNRFGADAAIVGKTVTLNDEQITVVGVMPPQLERGFKQGVFVPLQAQPNRNHNPNSEVVGRLKPGVTMEQAQAEMKLIADKYRAAFPQAMQDGESIYVRPYRNLFTDDIKAWLWILLGAVLFLLLIACANVANLQLTRAAARQREIAVRMALGAGGGRIVRQLLTEGLLLALLGGAAGLLLAIWGTELLIALAPQGLLPAVADVRLDWRVMLFALVAAIGTGLLFGLAPAWQARKVDVNTALKENASRGGSARGRLRSILVVSEIALSLMLLVGAGLLLRTFANLLNVPLGFDPNNVLTFQVALNGSRYDTTAESAQFYQAALDHIRNLPGVEAAAITNKLPLDWQFNTAITFADKPDQYQSVQFRTISPDYFKVMKIALRQGRDFAASDNASAAPVAIVNEAFVQKFAEGKDPFARQFATGRKESLRQVVGIVADTKQMGLDRPALPTVFVPLAQLSDETMAMARSFNYTTFVVRTTIDPATMQATLKREMAAVDSTLPLAGFRTMDDLMTRSIASQRFYMLLLGLFALLGLVLAAVGIYGVMSYAVAERTNELGIRIALGASSRDVLRLILKHGLQLAVIGLGIGLVGALGLTRVMKGFLFGVSATDPATFALIALLLLAVAGLACYWPARRATKVDPLVALRYE